MDEGQLELEPHRPLVPLVPDFVTRGMYRPEHHVDPVKIGWRGQTFYSTRPIIGLFGLPHLLSLVCQAIIYIIQLIF